MKSNADRPTSTVTGPPLGRLRFAQRTCCVSWKVCVVCGVWCLVVRGWGGSLDGLGKERDR
jgi:hypothetical protein